MGERAAINTQRTPRAGRPATPLITRRSAAQAALALIDRDGLDALSLQAVAQVLGVSAPSLYHHFRNKDELLAEVARALIIEIGQDGDTAADDWEARIIKLSLATRRVALRHPYAAPLTLRFFPRQLTLVTYEATLAQCPYPPETHMIILEALERFTYGAALFAAAAVVHQLTAMPDVDATRFPRLAQAIGAAPDDETLHIEALRAILDGFRVRFGQAAT